MTDSHPGEEAAEPSWVAEGLPYVSFNQLRSFHAVALTGSVTAAAKLLHVGQPTVTTQFRQLESTYKVELALRLPTGVRLTPMGQQLFRLTETLFHVQAEAVDLLNGEEGRLHGTLRLGSVAPDYVMHVLAGFAAEHPEVKVDLTLNDSTTIAQKIADCELDVAIVGSLGLDSRFLSVPFSRQKIVVVAPADKRWSRRSSIGLHELGAARLVMRKGGSASRQVLEAAFKDAGVTAAVTLEVDREGALAAVRAGLGLTVATTAEAIDDDRLKVLRIDDVDLHTDAIVICLAMRQKVPLVAAFLESANRYRLERGRRRGSA